jgi:hypothetical protein
MSAGGFNPRYTPPPNFPGLDRLAIALAQSNNPRLRLEAYLALTTNSAQFGARAELYASKQIAVVGLLEVEAALGFDALFYFDPFGFVVDLHGHATLRRNSKPFLGITIDITLSGPEPWHGEGWARFEFFGDREVRVELTIGQRRQLPARVGINVEDLVKQALARPDSWEALLPDGSATVVTLRSAPTADGLVVHPLGRLSVRQQVAPLNKQLALVGNEPIVGAKKITVNAVHIGSQSYGRDKGLTDLSEYFAPAQFFAMSEEQKMVSPAFELHHAGVALGAPDTITATGRRSYVQKYETVVVDDLDRRVTKTSLIAKESPIAIEIAAQAGAVAMFGKTSRPEARLTGEKLGISVSDPHFTIVSTAQTGDGVLAASSETYATYGAALSALQEIESDDLQIIPAYEAALA